MALSTLIQLSATGALLLASCSSPAQPAAADAGFSTDSGVVRQAAGAHYARGPVWRFFWGAHYRAIWATPVTVPVFSLATAVPGGLVPVQAGGSFQSKSLRLQAPSGRQYLLRSVDKDASAALTPGWKRRLLGGLMKDQTSAGLPYGAYVAAQLAEAAGVYHTNPRLVYLADDPGLGKFRSSYAKAFYLFEERPDGDQRTQPSFGRSAAVINTQRMLANSRRHPTARVEARSYLRARLLDILLGDWSRREDQWRWASFRPTSGGVVYRPIPRDRDQAFFLFNDGLITGMVAWFVPKYHSFHAKIPLKSVDALTETARALDRTLLATLSAKEFRAEADLLVARLSDAAIAQSLLAGPAETRVAMAAHLGPRLRARRNQLPAVAQRYYQLLNKEAWLVGTDQSERFVLSAGEGNALRAQHFLVRAGQPDSLVNEREYLAQDSPKLQVYGLGGNDIFELRGPLPARIAVQLYDGAGQDVVKIAGAGSFNNVTWLTSADNSGAAPASIEHMPDPHPELTTDGAAWLKRYRLED